MTNNQKSDISVALATYNGSRYLGAQLRSLSEQSLLPAELIVCDDCSEDETVKILEKYAVDAPFPVTIVQNDTRLGYADNFMKAATLTNCKWVAFCDQDDFWYSTKLSKMRFSVVDEQVLLVTHPSRVMVDENVTNKLVNKFPCGIFDPLTLNPMHLFFGNCIMFRREILEFFPADRRPFNPHIVSNRFPHDEWITFLAGALGKTVILSDALLSYRHHGNNASQEHWKKTFRERLKRARVDGLRGRQISLEGSRARAKVLMDVQTNDLYFERNRKLAVIYYKRFYGIMFQRLDLWSTPSVWRRIQLFCALAASGAYRSFPRGGSGIKQACKDLVFGVF